MDNMKLIEAKTVGAGGVAYIEFTDIPQTYTDLHISLSVRASANAELYAQVNNSTSGYTNRTIQGNGTGTSSGTYQTSKYFLGEANWSSFTANTFSSQNLYLPNYTSSLNKSLWVDSVTENNATTAYEYLIAGLWSNNAAINSIKFTISSGTFNEYSTFYLYGTQNILAGGAKATGGYVTEDTNYFYHTFLSSGTFTPTQSISADILVVAGGGGGGRTNGGGGGAGGLLAFTSQSLSATGYSVTVGSGGSGATSMTTNASLGGDSQFGALTLVKGGGGGQSGDVNGTALAGGSGAGAGGANFSNTGGSPTSGQGFAGGNSSTTSAPQRGAGGGGASAAGGTPNSSSNGGAGGNGLNTYSSWATATLTGDQGYYAGGGGGGTNSGAGGTPLGGAGGLGGGAKGNYQATQGVPIAAMINTGGGGGGSGGNGDTANGGNGGSGIVIVRYAK